MVGNSCHSDQDVVVAGPSEKSPRIENRLLKILRTSLKEEINSEIKSILVESQKKVLRLLKRKTENVIEETEDDPENETRSFYTPTKSVRINSTHNNDPSTNRNNALCSFLFFQRNENWTENKRVLQRSLPHWLRFLRQNFAPLMFLTSFQHVSKHARAFLGQSWYQLDEVVINEDWKNKKSALIFLIFWSRFFLFGDVNIPWRGMQCYVISSDYLFERFLHHTVSWIV